MLLRLHYASLALFLSLFFEIAASRLVNVPNERRIPTTKLKSSSSSTSSSHSTSLSKIISSSSNSALKSTSSLKVTSTPSKPSTSTTKPIPTSKTSTSSISKSSSTSSLKTTSTSVKTTSITKTTTIATLKTGTTSSLKGSSISKSTSASKASTISSVSTSESASAGPQKRGLPYNDATLTNSFVGPNSQISWGYNWYQTPGAGFPAKYEYVPMLWSNSSDLTSTWTSNVNAAIASGTTHLLAFNEPDYSGQANMSPLAAAQAYMKWMQPFAGRVKLGAPAVTNGGPPMGVEWLKEFMGNCTACTIDFTPLHWYDGAFNYGYFKYYIEYFYAQIGKPIWITEFNGYGDDATVISFLDKVMPWLDSLSYVQRYAWFWCADGYLLSTGTTLSNYGVVYMNYTSTTLDPYFAS